MIVFILFLLAPAFAFDHAELARSFAPTIYQELGSDPRFDEFTRIDFDGDWDASNNWVNAGKFPRPAALYWDVREFNDHYYVTYGIFFPRDYSSWCFWIHCHENDFEGMRVVVNKEKKAISLETLAHLNSYTQLNPPEIKVRIEAEGHGIYLLSGKLANHKTYTPSDYELRPMQELWENRESLFEDSFMNRGVSYPKHFKSTKWSFYGWGRALPPWSWEIRGSKQAKGDWYLYPAPLTNPDGSAIADYN